MTREKIIGLIIAVLLIAAVGSYPLYSDLLRGGDGGFSVDFPSAAGPSGNPGFELAAADLPPNNTMMVYKVENPVVTTDSVQQIGRKVGFEGGAGYIDRDTKIAMLNEGAEEVRQLSVWVNSGAVEYAIVYPDKLYPPEPPDLPSEEEARQIAVDFLAQSGLLPPDATIGDSYETEVVTGGAYAIEEEVPEEGVEEAGEIEPEVVEEYVTHLLVRFHRRIDGFPVTGSGNKFGVRIGDEGEVITILKVWREVTPYRKVAVKTAEQAYQELKSGAGSYYAPLDCEKVVVEQVYLAYWMEPLDEHQEYVVPVYEFKGKCLDKDGEYLEAFVGWCEAVK
ncbi:MAG: hypothetical protein R6V59_09340 [Dehalococcoidia bacterium]